MKKSGFSRRSFISRTELVRIRCRFHPRHSETTGDLGGRAQAGAGSRRRQRDQRHHEPPGSIHHGRGGKILPENVTEKGKHHILGTLAAMVSGSRLKAGVLATKFAHTQGGTPEAQVIGADLVSTAINAAMVNGFMAHANETDQAPRPSITHPGCAHIRLPGHRREGECHRGGVVLRAVVLGYDVSSRIAQVVQRGYKQEGHSAHFHRPPLRRYRGGGQPGEVRHRPGEGYALAYTGQQASGITSWVRTPEHVEKAFVLHMGARNGVTSVLFAVQHGFTGEEDIFAGQDNFLEIFCKSRNSFYKWIDSLGTHYKVIGHDQEVQRRLSHPGTGRCHELAGAGVRV